MSAAPPSGPGPASSPLAIHGLLAGSAYAALSLIGQGYRYGVADHVLHLPIAAQVRGVPLPGGDLLAGAAAAHPTLWWWLFGALSPSAALAVHLLLLVGAGAALYRLARGLVGPAAPWAIVLLAIGQASLGGADTADSLLLPRTAALPLELLAWAWFVEGRRSRSFALLGATVCLHAPSAVALGAALAVLHLAQRRPLLPLLGLPLMAAPVLIPYLLQGAGPLRLSPEHAAVIELRLGHHVAAGTWPTSAWLTAAGWLAVVGLAWRRLTPGLRGSIAALLGVAILGGGGGWALRIALPVQLELWQAARFFTIAAAIAAAAVLVDGRRGAREAAALLLATGAVMPGAGLLLLARIRGRSRAPHPLFWLLLVAALALSARHPLSARSPARWFVHPPRVPLDAAVQALPSGALLATPPTGLEGLRRGGRGLYGTWKDGGEALFDADRASAWRDRMMLVAGPSATSPLGRSLGRGARQAALRRRLREGFEAMDLAAVAPQLRADGVRYLIWRGAPHSDGSVLASESDLVLLDLEGRPQTATIAP